MASASSICCGFGAIIVRCAREMNNSGLRQPPLIPLALITLLVYLFRLCVFSRMLPLGSQSLKALREMKKRRRNFRGRCSADGR